MKHYLHYRNNNIIGYSNVLVSCDDFECREVTKEEYDQFILNKEKQELKIQRIKELKQLLEDYDYIGTKIATGRGTREQYATEIAQMTVWADEINELEASL